ncbi:MAG: NAD(P)-dependent oxidoreductase [Calothrix sp. MO_167.B12]|nr:NAD(P)-dependent oxidoreductase [Calothrix sp. MO_167.B12]
MTVLIAYPLHSETIEELGKDFVYLPQIDKSSDTELCSALKKHHPSVLLVGNNTVSELTIKFWRTEMGDQQLLIVRRGSSLALIDTNAASLHGIDIINTPGVNAPFVADYIYRFAQEDCSLRKASIIGFGSIGSRVATQCLSKGFSVYAYSPSMAGRQDRIYKDIVFCKSINECINRTDFVSIAIPSTQDEPNPTHGIITHRHILSIQEHATLVSVSEPDIFSDQALGALVERIISANLIAIFDNKPALMEELARKLQIISPRLHLCSEAMKSPECQLAMDVAALKKIEDWYLNLTNYQGQ